MMLEVKIQVSEKNNSIRAMLTSKSGNINLWYLDGKYLLNGTRTLNSTHKTEEI